MSIFLLGLLLFTSFLLGLGLTPIARGLARRTGLVDQPDGQRKMQREPVPLGGGLAVLLAASIALVGAALLWPALADSILSKGHALPALLASAVVICAVGLADDYRSLRGRHKLFGQLLAVSIVLGSGLVVNRISLFGWVMDLGVLALPFTAFWLLGAINSLNLIDGMDGLLSSFGAIITLAMGAMAAVTGDWATAAVAAALAGALFAFLCFNFPPASIYLGDSGSMLVGLVVGVLAITSSLKQSATVALAAPAALLTIPIFDTMTAIVRRKLTGRSIYTTDRGHIHHCLQRSGLSTRRALHLVSGLCLLTVAGVLASLLWNNELLAIIAALTVVGILVVGRLFGYAEFLLIKERLGSLWFAWRHGQSGSIAHQIEVRLQGSVDWKEIWQSLTEEAARLNLTSLCLDVNIPFLHEGYHARWDRLNNTDEVVVTWRADIPLVVDGHAAGRLEITGTPGAEPMTGKIAAMAALAEGIERKITALILPVAESANGQPSRNGTHADGAITGIAMPAGRAILPPAPE
jgi:UDP-GlcNAc:undecaprenyl-phosphate GlcNAc-1-phosphate transferase